MAIDRFYLPDLDTHCLSGDEARHCQQVLRHKVGDRVALFDGKGNELMAEISTVSKESVAFKPISRNFTPALPVAITLVQAIPKHRHFEDIIQKACELGACDVIPVISERTVVQVDDEKADAKLAKWKQVAIESSKQCGRNWLTHILAPLSARDLLSNPPAAQLLLVASLQPDACSLKQILADFRAEKQSLPQSVAIFIGPEGDFTPAELSKARSVGCRPLTLGPIILRCETAVCHALSILSYELQG